MGKRFDITKKDKINSWSMNDSLAKYTLLQMNCFIRDCDIKEQILPEFPIPENLTCKKEIDLKIKFLLSQKKTKETLSLFGPLSQIGDFLECQKNTFHDQVSQIEGEVPINVTEMLTTAQDCWTNCLITDVEMPFRRNE